MDIKELRKLLNLTQVEFAKKLDINPTTVSRWENNKRKPRPIYKRKMERMLLRKIRGIIAILPVGLSGKGRIDLVCGEKG